MYCHWAMTKRDGREVGFKDGSKFKLGIRFSLMLVLGLGYTVKTDRLK